MSLTLILIGIVTILAGIVQRLTGFGFALVATAPLVALYGPDEGVRIVAAIGFVASSAMLTALRREIDWRRCWQLIWPAILISPLAALVAHLSSDTVLMFIVGGSAIFSLVGGKFLNRLGRLEQHYGSFAAGALGGFLHVTSGLSAPPLVAFAEKVEWQQKSLVASMQAIFAFYYALTIAWRGLPALPTAIEIVVFALALAGVAIGSRLVRIVPISIARGAMFLVAWAGTTLVLIRAFGSL